MHEAFGVQVGQGRQKLHAGVEHALAVQRALGCGIGQGAAHHRHGQVQVVAVGAALQDAEHVGMPNATHGRPFREKAHAHGLVQGRDLRDLDGALFAALEVGGPIDAPAAAVTQALTQLVALGDGGEGPEEGVHRTQCGPAGSSGP